MADEKRGPRPCKGCGMTIEMIRNAANGKFLPAQKIRTVYLGQIDLTSEWTLSKDSRLDGEAIYVSHFETCPKADNFSGRNG